MSEDVLVCFCTEKTQAEVKEFIREGMKGKGDVDNDLLYEVHKSFAGEAIVGRCCGCMDEVEELMVAYKQGIWS
tara:strand:+ start:44840 stop:45061 length:222 start_codon:yes stop_codon:yes gene_type:complete